MVCFIGFLVVLCWFDLKLRGGFLVVARNKIFILSSFRSIGGWPMAISVEVMSFWSCK